MVKLIFLFVSSILFSAPAQERFFEANKLFDSGDYESSGLILEEINPKNFSVYYNLGSCFFQRKDFPKAIYNWKKAQNLANFSEYLELEQKIKNANEMLGLLIKCGIYHKLKLYLFALARNFQPIFWQILFLLFWLLFLFLRVKFRWLCFSVSLFLLVLITVLEFSKQQGITLDKLVLYAGPDSDYHQVGSLKKGEQFSVIENKEKWYKVMTKDFKGWAGSDSILLI